MLFMHIAGLVLLWFMIRAGIRRRRRRRSRVFPRRSPPQLGDPVTLLQDRYARGEFSLAEFEVRMTRLLRTLDS